MLVDKMTEIIKGKNAIWQGSGDSKNLLGQNGNKSKASLADQSQYKE